MLNIYAGTDKDGTKACIWQRDGSKEQQFRVVNIGSNKYKIYALCSSNGYGRVLDTNRGTSISNPLKYGLKIDIWSSNDAPAQEWYIIDLGNGYYKVELAALKDGMVTSAGSANNSNITLEKNTGAYSQQWKFAKVG
nr:RICIN domain-containing protein [Anaerobacterium chartisolvens]